MIGELIFENNIRLVSSNLVDGPFYIRCTDKPSDLPDWDKVIEAIKSRFTETILIHELAYKLIIKGEL